MDVMVKVDSVVKTYGKSHALDGLSVELEVGKQYAIQGASGSGKSTLLYLLGGLDRPSSGSISVDGKDLAGLNDEELAQYRNEFVGFVFQFHFLLPSMTCLKNILLPAQIGGRVNEELEKEVSDLSELLGVKHCLNKFPFELSGGEQQRINIIRALSLKPKLLLCDEPTGNLDSGNSLKVIELIKDLALKANATLIVVTHDPEMAKKFENNIFVQDGLIRS